MLRPARRAAVAALTALAAVAAIIAADLTPPAAAQSEEETTGRIVARRLDDGRVEFGWQPTGGGFGRELTPDGNTIFRYVARVLPAQRYFPTDATVDRWLRSSPVEFGEQAIGRIEARLLSDGRIEFAFTPTDGERILTDARYFPTETRLNRWLRSTEITIGAPSPFIAVSAGYDHACAIRENGALECWGFTNGEQIDTPEGSFTAVSVGFRHNCAIHDTGDLECWGSNISWLITVPRGSYRTISAGFEHTCAIAETFAGTNTVADTGEIECWGNNSRRRQLYADPSDASAAWPGRYRAVSAAREGTCAVRDTGEIQCRGSVTGGQVGGEFRNISNDLIILAGPPEGSFTAVSAAHGYTCGLRESGAIACWGDTDAAPFDNSLMNHQAPEGSYTAISAGGGEACAIRDTGEIECWGVHGKRAGTPTGRFTAISAGSGHTCAIRESDGEIECWTAAGWQH